MKTLKVQAKHEIGCTHSVPLAIVVLVVCRCTSQPSTTVEGSTNETFVDINTNEVNMISVGNIEYDTLARCCLELKLILGSVKCEKA